MGWTETLILPYSMWLPCLFNPTSFLTAIKQATGRLRKFALDNMGVETHMTTMRDEALAVSYPEDGAFVHGIYMEGARWQDADEAAAYPEAVVVESNWEPTAVGFIRPTPPNWKDQGVVIYNCPVYSTTFRGPTYVFVAYLKSKDREAKWTSAAVALMFQTDDV